MNPVIDKKTLLQVRGMIDANPACLWMTNPRPIPHMQIHSCCIVGWMRELKGVSHIGEALYLNVNGHEASIALRDAEQLNALQEIWYSLSWQPENEVDAWDMGSRKTADAAIRQIDYVIAKYCPDEVPALEECVPIALIPGIVRAAKVVGGIVAFIGMYILGINL